MIEKELLRLQYMLRSTGACGGIVKNNNTIFEWIWIERNVAVYARTIPLIIVGVRDDIVAYQARESIRSDN